MKKTNESGRSMVEMLGVLAIIGVLSVGGIAGYTMAMNKYNANEIVNAVVQGAVHCRTQGTVPSDVKTGVKGLATLACGDYFAKATGVVKFTINSSADVAKLVCKSLKLYSAQQNTGALSGEITCDSGITDSTFSTLTYYYQPTT